MRALRRLENPEQEDQRALDHMRRVMNLEGSEHDRGGGSRDGSGCSRCPDTTANENRHLFT